MKVSISAFRGHVDKVYNGDGKNEEDEEDDDGGIDANNYGGDYDLLVFWLKVSIII